MKAISTTLTNKRTFEIRTLNDFTRSKKAPRTLALLANPNGYEIMPATGKMSYSGRQSVKTGIIMLIIYAAVGAGICFFVGLNPFF